jgi:hypothetical protein
MVSMVYLKKNWFLPTVILGSVIALINIYVWQSPLLGFLTNASILFCCGAWLGQAIFPLDKFWTQIGLGVLFILITLALVGGTIYSLWGLPDWQRIFLAIFIPPVTAWLGHHFYHNPPTLARPVLSISRMRSAAWLLAIYTLSGTIIWLLWQARTGEAIRSPWEILPRDVLLLYFFLQALVFTWLLRRPSNEQVGVILTSGVLVGVELALGLLVYQVGYGFDSFVHQATESLILKQGLVEPRHFYYLGQYGVVVILASITLLSVVVIDRWLLPLLATVAFPILTRYLPDPSPALRAAVLLSLTALPLSSFIQTTPQGIANLLFLACLFTIFFSARWSSRPLLGATTLALGSAVFHPLAGIPALGLLILKIVYEKIGRWASVACAGFFLTIIPLIFIQQEFIRVGSLKLTGLANYLQTADLVPYFTDRYTPWFDLTYLYGFNLGWIIVALAVAGGYQLWRRQELHHYLPFFLLTGWLIIDALVLQFTVPFKYLIDYERDNFSARLIELTAYSLLPFAALALLDFLKKIRQAPVPIALAFILILAGLRTAGLYLTYPRFDSYAYDRGYSTSLHDLATVKEIEADANQPYVVLANQAVSAAALQELSFNKYYLRQDQPTGEQIFFYPIPTGGSLYQHYLDMVYKEPSRATALAAMNSVGVDRLYLVVNDYWFDSKNIASQAEQTATRSWTIGQSKNFIFVYDR